MNVTGVEAIVLQLFTVLLSNLKMGGMFSYGETPTEPTANITNPLHQIRQGEIVLYFED